MSTQASPARPRIQEDAADQLRGMYRDVPFERATNRAIDELHAVRALLAESIVALDNEEIGDEHRQRREELVAEVDATALVRMLRMRLRDRGIAL